MLVLLALPAGVATWSGWVGLGEKTGFGMVTPLPGIADGFQINTAITLPLGVETYAAYALGAWLKTGSQVSETTRTFAKWSAVGSLALGMLGQIAFHLLEISARAKAPDWITAAVSVLPVLVLGMGAALGHLLTRDAAQAPESPAEQASDLHAVATANPRPNPPARAARRPKRTAVKRTVAGIDDLMPVGRSIAADLEGRGLSLTRDRLLKAVRDTGRSMSSDRASALLARLKNEANVKPAEAVLKQRRAA
ncbi:hypothetical protein AB0B45_46590 [Nonomuraea sp. NPDC049152]|uniref:hypothetical protein n=1 Tax=Nonomuraea sp. NPDC049152 TaxID=3154350 RepID=UPI0033D71DD7